MRMDFLRGVITGGILGAVLGLLLAPQKQPERKGFARIVRPRRSRLQAIGKTVNEVGKTVNEFIKK